MHRSAEYLARAEKAEARAAKAEADAEHAERHARPLERELEEAKAAAETAKEEAFKRGIAAMERAFFQAIVVLRKQSKGIEVTNEPKDPLEIRLAVQAQRIVENILP